MSAHLKFSPVSSGSFQLLLQPRHLLLTLCCRLLPVRGTALQAGHLRLQRLHPALLPLQLLRCGCHLLPQLCHLSFMCCYSSCC